ncbi:MAG TPA: glycosyltransferase, partial [Mariniflexile sp.]
MQNSINKYLYVDSTKKWHVYLMAFLGITTWLLVYVAFVKASFVDPFFRYFLLLPVTILSVYYFIDYGIWFAFKPFSRKVHDNKIDKYWKTCPEPSVDVFIPICGEEIKIIEETLKAVSELDYKNFKCYLLDDSKAGQNQNKILAGRYNFNYIERPDKGRAKRAGNVNYGLSQSKGKFIAVFDADFCPEPSFLSDTIPYMEDKKIGLVQTPQYFKPEKQINSIMYGAAYQVQNFYRITQLARERWHGAICVGTNFIYRREAIITAGGEREVEACQDSRTGLAIAKQGYHVKYIPLVLASGLCPLDIYSFFHQQHRWAGGGLEMLLNKWEFWPAKVSLWKKICVTGGVRFYLARAASVLVSFHLFWVLFVYNDYIDIEHSIWFIPYVLFNVCVSLGYTTMKPKIGQFKIGLVQSLAILHSTIATIFRKRAGWIPAGAKQSSISSTFKQMYSFMK